MEKKLIVTGKDEQFFTRIPEKGLSTKEIEQQLDLAKSLGHVDYNHGRITVHKTFQQYFGVEKKILFFFSRDVCIMQEKM